MTWQDIVLSVGSWLFALALLPAVLHQEKPALLSSILTAVVLTAYSFTYITLSFWSAAASTLLVAGLWYVLAAQKIRQNRARSRLTEREGTNEPKRDDGILGRNTRP